MKISGWFLLTSVYVVLISVTARKILSNLTLSIFPFRELVGTTE